MKNKKLLFILVPIFTILLIFTAYLSYKIFFVEDESQPEVDNTQALMLLIEFEDTVGLNNMVFQMNERNIPGVLLVSAEYVEANCDFVKGLQEYGVEIAGVYPNQPLWDIEYDVQYELIRDTKDRIEACMGTQMKAFGSRYFAYDENTIKVAQELDLEYVFARGTTGAKASIYKPEEYDVKIFSVSNVDSENWGTGSLCDYSYWAREGTSEDFDKELQLSVSKYGKVSPVSHTYIGGAKASWNDVYVKLFDTENIDWVNLDTFGNVDYEMSFAQIPTNRDVQYDTPHPAVPLDQEEGVSNPCGVIEIEGGLDGAEVSDLLTVFHNGTGPMCLEALSFLEDNGIEYIEYLNTDSEYAEKLALYKGEVSDQSEGISTSFSYYPIIFYKGRAFSGFNEEIENQIIGLK